MIETSIIIIAIISFFTAAFTLMSGFGLGTILTSIFLLFYDVKIAILTVAVVHLMNNLLKISLFGKHVSLNIVKRFGIWTVAGAFIGASLQGKMDSSGVKILLGAVLIFIGLKEVTGIGERMRIPQRMDFFGGLLSGLLGGLVGNQGAVRSTYLLHYDISKETFVATSAAIASLVDFTRIPIYIVNNKDQLVSNTLLVFITVLSAFAGTFAGKTLLHIVPLKIFRMYVAVAIVAIGILLSLGKI